MEHSTLTICKRAKAVAPTLATLAPEVIDRALSYMADALVEDSARILAENERDLVAARGTVSEVMLDRLALNESRILGMANGVREVAALESAVGRVIETTVRPNGLTISKVAVPLGVIAIIYESRPNVTSDAAALALKSGNACVLKCGKEAYRTSVAIVDAMRRGLCRAGISEDAVCLLEDCTREGAAVLMRASGLVDLLIPRGGRGLIRACVEGATVPCLETGTGICHVYVDKDADPAMALSILENAKTSRPSVCNAAEVCLLHRDVVSAFLPRLYERLVTKREEEGKTPVELRLSSELAAYPYGVPAGDADFDTEFLDYVLAVRAVDSVEEAIAHIAAHSTGHSEAIVTADEQTAETFVRHVDSAAVYVNASTRFTDGGEFGLGCEMGISTQKMHARGPLGIRELTSYKYVVRGNGQVR